ncbi:hypothetical protein ACJ72_01557 [Emergomyces africanus]|uniref:Uncharacterized protein n=1 Tax=Emergomyces africanus TaxID=1955775 RepID=A0A1B7P518_9EURO|nr:hypothetical protein ACJ72_01557 [Emergomyces africanus]
MYTVAQSISNSVGRHTQTTPNSYYPGNKSTQDLQQPPDFQLSYNAYNGYHTPNFRSLQPQESNLHFHVNASGSSQDSMTNIDGSFAWPTIMPPGDHELGASFPDPSQNECSLPFHYDAQPEEHLSWNTEHLQNPSRMNTFHSPEGSFSQFSQNSWTESSHPDSYSSLEMVNYIADASARLSQTSSIPGSWTSLIDTDNHSTSVDDTTRVAHSQAAATDGVNFTPHRIGNGRSSGAFKGGETRGEIYPGRKTFRSSLTLGSSRSASSKKVPQFQETKRPFVEHTFHASTGEPVARRPYKRRRTKYEKQETASIVKIGGACEKCRRKHRRCSLSHHTTKDTRSTQSPRIPSRTSAPSPNSQESYPMLFTLSASNSSATSAATHHETEEMATSLRFPARYESLDYTTRGTVKVEGQLWDTRNAIPGWAATIAREHGNLGPTGNNSYGIQDGQFHLGETNIDNY